MRVGRWVVLAAVLSAVAAAFQEPPPPRPRPDGSQWTDIHQDAARLAQAIKNLENSTWDSTYIGWKSLEDAGLDCVTVQNNTWTFLEEVGVDFATQLAAGDLINGEYFGQANTILNVANSDMDDYKTIVHEAQHHAGWGVGVTDSTELARIESLMADATDCQLVVKKKDDDDDDGPGGNTGTTETCTESLEWVPPVTESVFVRPEPSPLEGGETLPGPPGVTPTYRLPPVIVGYDNGEWVDVVIEKGYWRTVKECTLS